MSDFSGVSNKRFALFFAFGRKGLRTSFFVVLCFFLPQTVFSHTPFENIGDFYNGVLHPFVVPSHALLILAAGLFVGQCELQQSHRYALFSMLGGLVLGLGSVGLGVSVSSTILALILTGFALLIGLLVAIKAVEGLRMTPVVLGIVFFSGFLIGLDSTLDGLQGKSLLVAFFGLGVSAYLTFLMIAGLSQKYALTFEGIVQRVLAGWIVAISMMVLVFQLVSST